MTISCPSTATVFIPPGVISTVLIAGMNLSVTPHILRWHLRQAIRVRDVVMDEEAAPTALHGIEILPVEGNAWADDLHVTSPVVTQRLAGAEWNAVFLLQCHLLLQQKIPQLRVGREFKAQRPDDLVEE